MFRGKGTLKYNTNQFRLDCVVLDYIFFGVGCVKFLKNKKRVDNFLIGLNRKIVLQLTHPNSSRFMDGQFFWSGFMSLMISIFYFLIKYSKLKLN